MPVSELRGVSSVPGPATPAGETGCIFNIQRYSVHDGPGIRTIVFMKGCPLRCRWCSNPESQRAAPELAYNPAKCIGDECGRCLPSCAPAAIGARGDGTVGVDRSRCNACLLCVGACPSRALHVFGTLMSVDEVLQSVDKDSLFYPRSGGGLTISGGEPLVQADFVERLLRQAKKRRIGTAMETCGHAEWTRLERVCRHLDTLIYDIKSVDTAKHRAHTGVGNELIVANLRRVARAFPALQIAVRTPLIPDFNDNEEAIAGIVDLLREFPAASYELLPYHRMGQSKYAFLGRADAMAEARLDEQRANSLAAFARTARGSPPP